ncbi:hypothetical protein PENSPDRAFT_691091 [Peniophora sp. CONT]|nr:hypothetical protein PENSPDRAFT_691091 [Peniophora sp. CONT]
MSSNTSRDGRRLPPDIIRLLFEHVAALSPPHSGHSSFVYNSDIKTPCYGWTSLGWITMTHICRDWRTVGLRMPLLWASIVTTFPDPQIANEFLARAGSCPITADIRERFRTTHWQHQHYNELLRSWTNQHITQVGVLRLTNAKHYDEMRGGDEGPLPRLRKIHIEDGYDRPRGLPPRSSFCTLRLYSPGLRSAILTDTILPPDSTRVLRELALTITHSAWASLSAFHEFLRCCPQLEILNLKAHGPLPHDLEYHARAVSLYKLKSTTVSATSEQAAWDIWQPIVAPVDVVFKLVIGERGSPALSRATPLILELCASHLSLEHYDAVKMDHRTITVHHSSNLSSGSCTIEQCVDANLFTALPVFLCIDQIRLLSLDCPAVGTDQINDVFRVIGRALTSVTDLSLKHMNQWATSLCIRALGRYMPTPIFPALQVLRVSDINLMGVSKDPTRSLTQYWWDTLIAVLKARSDAKGEALRCIVLEGIWSNALLWDLDQDREKVNECRSRGLVQEVNDQRTFLRTG